MKRANKFFKGTDALAVLGEDAGDVCERLETVVERPKTVVEAFVYGQRLPRNRIRSVGPYLAECPSSA